MKNKFLKMLACSTVLFGLFSPAHAGLIDISTGSERVIYDDVNQNYWIWDLSMFVEMEYDETQLAIDSLDYFGLDTWEMADQNQIDSLFAELSHENTYVYDLFGKSAVTVDFQGDSNDNWMARYDQHLGGPYNPIAGAYVAWNDDLYHGSMIGSLRTDYAWDAVGAWVVTQAPIQQVSEPASLYLIGIGLVGVWATRRRKIEK